MAQSVAALAALSRAVGSTAWRRWMRALTVSSTVPTTDRGSRSIARANRASI